MTARTTYRRRGAAGFTLPELLVAVAIFATLMAGVTLVLTNTVQTARQAEQTRQAFDLVRGALHVLERDLISAYSARDRGDVHYFYGTPIGMTFVGLVEDSRGIPRLGRITYVLHQSEVMPETAFSSHEVRRIILGGDRDELVGDRDLFRYNLLRFVEPGAESLERLPFPEGFWDQQFDPEAGTTFADVLASQRQQAINDGVCAAGDEACLRQVGRAVELELWIRMLAGAPGTGFWIEHRDDPAGLGQPPYNPYDFVLLENIVAANYLDQIRGGVRSRLYDTLLSEGDAPTLPPFFRYGRPASPDVSFVDTWQAYDNMFQHVVGVPADELPPVNPPEPVLGSPLLPKMPEIVRSDFMLFFDSPYPGASPFLRHFDQEVHVRTGYTRTRQQEP